VFADLVRAAEAKTRVNALAQRIAALISEQGPLSIAQFMTMALHDPELGYYATRDIIGTGGDFITAPEISQMFGEMLGLWCVQVWHDQAKPASIRLVELGPGRGTLMEDALRAAQVAPEFCAALDVVMVEASPVLQAQQQERLKDIQIPIRWTANFEQPDRPLLLIANEFFDALPISQYVKTLKGWRERMVTLDAAGKFAFALAPVPIPDAAIPPSRDGAPDGAVYEVSQAASALTEEIARAVAAKGGGALIVDYGYDRPDFGETLQAVADHSFAAVLEDPGESDLSAHVDFPALMQAVARGGATAFGPMGQGEFLMDLGMGARTEYLINRNRSQTTSLADAMERLVSPEQMGTLFKTIAIMPPKAPTPPGF
jgi:SAM-dependent MidA family methyltransferase